MADPGKRYTGFGDLSASRANNSSAGKRISLLPLAAYQHFGVAMPAWARAPFAITTPRREHALGDHWTGHEE